MRVDDEIKLIDLDASVNYRRSIETAPSYVGYKYSTGFIPPELIYVTDKRPHILTPRPAHLTRYRLAVRSI